MMTTVPLGGFARWLLAHRRSLLFLLGLLVLGGVAAAWKMPVSLFPSVSFPRIVVSLDAGDRSAEQMQLEVTMPIERALRAVPGVRAVNSTTSRGSAEIDLRFAWGDDLPQKLLQVQALLAQTVGQLPAGTRFAVKRMDPTRFPVIAYSLTATNHDGVAMRRFAELTVLPAISSVPGVRKVGIQGGAIAEYSVRKYFGHRRNPIKNNRQLWSNISRLS